MANYHKTLPLDRLEREISEALTAARRTARALRGFPGDLPADLAACYRIQSYSIEQWPDEVVGWKVGRVPPAFRDQFDTARLTGPIFARSFKRAVRDQPTEMPVFEGGFAAIEPEFIMLLAEQREDDRLFIGAEIASSPIPAISGYGPKAVVCDFGNNNGLLIGDEIADWQQLPGPLTVRTWVDDVLIGERSLEVPFQDALAARDFFLAHAQSHGHANVAGMHIATGAISGIHEAAIGARSKVSFGPLGDLALTLGRMPPII